MPSIRHRVRPAVAWGAAILLLGTVAAGCDTNRTSVLDPVGPPAYDFNVSPAAAGLPSGSVALAVTATDDSTVTLTLRGLRDLQSGVFQFLTVDAAGGTATPAFGVVVEHFASAADDTVSFSSATYAGSADPDLTSVTVLIAQSDASNTVNPYVQHAVVVSLESGQASTPSAAQFLWRRIGGGAGALSFGNFDSADPAGDYVYVVAANGRGGFRDGELSVDLFEVSRPPVGFFYRGFLVDEADVSYLVDTLRSAHNTTPSLSRVNLYNADVDNALPAIVGNDIRTAQLRGCLSGSTVTDCVGSIQAADFKAFSRFVLTLDPKGAASGLGTAVTVAGDVPEPVKN
jgi:hypothetical protein